MSKVRFTEKHGPITLTLTEADARNLLTALTAALHAGGLKPEVRPKAAVRPK